MNVALVGSNFSLRGYLPAINKIRKLKLKIICSRDKNKISKHILKKVDHENDWKKIFVNNIDLIILAVPPKLQEKILLFNMKYKKKIIFEKPISQNYKTSKKIVEKMIKNKIKSEINLTYLNHSLFEKVKNIIRKEKIGRVVDYKVNWDFVSIDFNKKIKSWKTIEKQGGGIKNIFLSHVLSYCEFFFGKIFLKNYKLKKSKFSGINFKKYIFLNLQHQKNINGSILLLTKKKGHQNHKIEINFERGKIILFTKSKDWTKNFELKIYHNKLIKKYKQVSLKKFKDGRSYQIHSMIKKFLQKPNFKHLNFCLNSELINRRII